MIERMAGGFRIGIVSGKLGGVDGVSLEVDKWITILKRMGHDVVTIAGAYTSPLESIPASSQLALPEIAFQTEQQKHYERLFFPYLNGHPTHVSRKAVDDAVEALVSDGTDVGEQLVEFVKGHGLDALVGQNTNAMPMTLLGGIGVHRMATQYRVPTIFHHHDFWWERSRFSNARIEPLLNQIMPPSDLGLEHIVISSYAQHILTSLKRVQPHVVPNCEDFDNPVWVDDYNRDFRSELGFSERDLLIVQPTRIVPRKRIEDSIRLLARLQERFADLRGRLQYIISLYQGDEPDNNYVAEIQSLAERLDIPLHMISDRVAAVRGTDAHGRKLFTNRDVLAHADLVTYLPIWEGFGNALLEAVAAKVPVVTTTYLVYKTDIMPAGFLNIEIRDSYDKDGHLVIPDHVLDEIEHLLHNPEERQEIVEHNFRVGQREFGYDTLQKKLEAVMEHYGDEIRAGRRRIERVSARYSV